MRAYLKLPTADVAAMTDDQILDALRALYRARTPMSRARSILIHRGGATAKRTVCVLCGAQVSSWCGRWRKTDRASSAEVQHRAEHVLAERMRQPTVEPGPCPTCSCTGLLVDEHGRGPPHRPASGRTIHSALSISSTTPLRCTTILS